MISNRSATPGTYRFRIRLPNEPPLDPSIAVAVFLYADEEHELDIELSQFLSRFDCSRKPIASCAKTCSDCSVQYVKQPFAEPGHWRRFRWPNDLRDSIHVIEWNANGLVRLSSFESPDSPHPVISEKFTLTPPARQRPYHLHISAWLEDAGGAQVPNSPRRATTSQEVVVQLVDVPKTLQRDDEGAVDCDE